MKLSRTQEFVAEFLGTMVLILFSDGVVAKSLRHGPLIGPLSLRLVVTSGESWRAGWNKGLGQAKRGPSNSLW